MSDPNIPRVKQEATGVAATTIGGVARTAFAPKIPVRRKPGEGAAAASGAPGGSLADLITVKEERKHIARPRLSSTHAPAAAARVAFQPSQPGQIGAASSASGDVSDGREVAVVVTHAPSTRLPGQDEAAALDKKARVKSEGAATGAAAAASATGAVDPTTGVSVDDVSAEDAAEEAELAGMLATESSYDSFLDNGDLVQYRPILLPFPKVRMGLGGAGGRASTVQRASVVPSPTNIRPGSSQSGVTSMFDIDEDMHESAVAAAAAAASAHASAASASVSARAPSPSVASYKMFPANSPARLLSHIDHEEKQSDGGISQNLLFFQFPSHLPFKQAETWVPPVNPLLSLNGNRQAGGGGATSNTAANAFGTNINAPGGASGPAAVAGAPSASLQALQNISSPMLPPMAMAGLGMPNLSLGANGGGATAGKGRMSNAPGSAAAAAAAAAGMDSSSALGVDDEQDLGEAAKSDPNKLSESERLAREHKAREARKLLLYSSNFEHAMRHLPAGQLGSLVIYKSGKIKMRIGDVLLDVNEGVQCLFHQELMSVQAATGEAFRLGAVHHRLVCTNDVEDLVRKTRERAIPTVEGILQAR